MSNKFICRTAMAIAIIISGSSCSLDIIQRSEQADEAYEEEMSLKTKSSPTDTIEYAKLPNPYALGVMQKVYDKYSTSKVTLEATDLYVRVLPQDSTQLNYLIYESGLEMFEYPLDIDFDEGSEYADSTDAEGAFSWLYTTIKPDWKFPSGYTFEVIEECYIPDDGEEIIVIKGEGINVEEAAFDLLGYEDFNEAGAISPSGTKKVYPEGTITIEASASEVLPVKGMKIRGHRFVKFSTAYTDENGHYELEHKFRGNLHYTIVFDNIKGFDIWGNYACFARAHIVLGRHSKNGYSKKITKEADPKCWRYSAINNAGYEYYKMCEDTGIPKPPAELKIWDFKRHTWSSTPLLRRVKNAIGLNSYHAWANFFANLGYGLNATVTMIVFNNFMPDIIIGTKDKKYNEIYEHVNHEMAHASHFRQVGSEYWAKYISYIMTYGSYGSGTGNNAELCGIGEMWGHFMGYCQEYENFEDSIPVLYPEDKPDGWITPHPFWELYFSNILTKKQIYDCLTYDVQTYDGLVSKMYLLYPEKADSIEEKFLNNGFAISVEKPVAADMTLEGKTISNDTEIKGGKISVRDALVTNGAMLTLSCKESVSLLDNFAVASNSGFIIQDLE